MIYLFTLQITIACPKGLEFLTRGVKIAKLNVDENPLIASQYTIQSIPTMLLFQDGKMVNRLVGALSKAEIERHLLAIMKTN